MYKLLTCKLPYLNSALYLQSEVNNLFLKSILHVNPARFGIPHHCSVPTEAIADVSFFLFSASVDKNNGLKLQGSIDRKSSLHNYVLS